MADDLMQLVDDFEQVVNAAMRVPMSNRVVLDERRCLDLLDQMRVLVPEEIRQARRIQQDRERTLKQALERSEQITRSAETRAERLLQEQGLTREADQFAAQRLADAQQEAAARRSGADQYIADVLTRLERLATSSLAEVEAGLEAIGAED